MKKHWQLILSAVLMGVMAASVAIQPANSQESGRKLLYLFPGDFPPDETVSYPPLATRETKFWQLLDKEMRATDDLSLTENMENADYRVELRCSGALNCNKLMVDVRNMKRDVLASFTVKGYRSVMGLVGPVKLDQVVHELTQRLDERLKLLEQGGYGATD